MIKYVIHIVLAFFLCFNANAQGQSAYFDIISAIETGNETIVQEKISNYEQQIAGNRDFAMAVYKELSSNNMNIIPDNIRKAYEKENWFAYYIAQNYAMKGDAENACKYLKNFLNSRQRVSRSEIRTAPSFELINTTREWEGLWNENFYSQADLDYESALHFYRDSQYNWALEEINPLISRYPNRHEFYALRAQVYLAQKQYLAAISDIEYAIRQNNRIALYYEIAGEANLRLKHTRKALEALSGAENLNPYSKNLLWLEIQAAVQDEDYQQAIVYAEAYTKYFPEADAIYMLADAQVRKQDFINAIRNMNTLLENYKHEAKYFKTRGDAFLGTGAWENAKKDYAMSLDFDPDQPEVYISYGICRFESGDTEGACYLWHKALHYKHPEANQYIYQNCLNR